eukprot:TRINITY_DN773_c2_g3_i1.p1 TRINITY_DN773_c2_g3~~TRINITY_DN773_c2_g3_i1.p1  ORF type:complete len:374 (-),score=192.02 TRINITY_DN773_c2_g3_i1:172-1293(-)
MQAHRIAIIILIILCFINLINNKLVGDIPPHWDGVIRETSDGRYEAYMKPPNAENHASFIAQLPSNELLIAWFSGEEEGSDNCSIYVSHLLSGSHHWTEAQLVSRRSGYSNQNPVLFYDPNSKYLYLFHSQQPAGSTDESKATIWQLISYDGQGNNWTEPQLLFSKPGSYDRHPIILSIDQSWLFPIYYAAGSSSSQYSSVQVLKQNSNSWKEYKVEDSNYLVQPCIVRPIPGQQKLYMFFRDRRAQSIYWAQSINEAQTWDTPKRTTLPNNNSGIQAFVLASGAIAMVLNPLSNKNRIPISIYLSIDGGYTWPYMRELEPACDPYFIYSGDYEFSYPTLLQTPDGFVHITYTYNRDTIKYIRVTEKWIKYLE